MAVEYPGRGARMNERCFVRLHALVAALVEDVRGLLTTPFAIYGHSLGALIGFELARQLELAGAAAPRALAVAGCRGPRLRPRKRPIFALPDDQLIEELRTLGGMDPAVLGHEELLQTMLPVLRADLEMADTYAARHTESTNLTVFVYGGANDEDTPPEDLQAWTLETRQPPQVRIYPGNHFFVHTAVDQLLQDVVTDLRTAMDPADHGAKAAGDAR